MAKKQQEHYKIVLGANSDEENLAKLREVYCKLKARFIVEEIEKYPEPIREQLFDGVCNCNTA